MCESGLASLNGKVSMKASAVKKAAFGEFYSARHISTPVELRPKYICQLSHPGVNLGKCIQLPERFLSGVLEIRTTTIGNGSFPLCMKINHQPLGN